MLNPPGSKKKITVGKKLFFLAAGILLLATLVTTFFGKKGFIDIQKQKKKYEELEARIKDFDRQIEKLKAEIEALETNPQTLEKEARERLWLIKPEEKLIIRKRTGASGQ